MLCGPSSPFLKRLKTLKKTLRILLIEDDQDDVDLLKEAFEDNNVPYAMDVIKDGGLVADFMDKRVSFPDIIILDFNLPRVHGRELLKRFKASPHFKDIPLIILTTSSAKEDMEYAIREGADRFLIKPSTVQGLNSVISIIQEIA